MKTFKICLAMIACLILSSNIFAAAPYQQQVRLITTSAHLDNTVPLKMDCATCIKLTKQDDHTYYITYNAPAKPTKNHMTFSYSYGDARDFCKYNADILFLLLKNGYFEASFNMPSKLDPSSTSKTCPQKVALFAVTSKNVTDLNIDW